MALAENAGMNALKSLSTAKSLQTEKNDPFHGVDCIGKGVTSMKEQKVF
jgi:chaperonin GroEL (HSP60 family)